MNLEEQRQLILSGKMYNDLTTELLRQEKKLYFLQMNIIIVLVSLSMKEKKY